MVLHDSNFQSKKKESNIFSFKKHFLFWKRPQILSNVIDHIKPLLYCLDESIDIISLAVGLVSGLAAQHGLTIFSKRKATACDVVIFSSNSFEIWGLSPQTTFLIISSHEMSSQGLPRFSMQKNVIPKQYISDFL
jgi:hypothetical protein